MKNLGLRSATASFCFSKPPSHPNKCGAVPTMTTDDSACWVVTRSVQECPGTPKNYTDANGEAGNRGSVNIRRAPSSIRCEASEGLAPAGEVVRQDEITDMSAELIVAIVVTTFDDCFPERPVHPLDQEIRPGMLRFGQ